MVFVSLGLGKQKSRVYHLYFSLNLYNIRRANKFVELLSSQE